MYGRIMASGFRNGFKNLKTLLFKRYLPHSYQFNSIVPDERNKYMSISRYDWKPCSYLNISEKEEIKIIFPLIYLTMFLFGFGAADFLYALKNNSRESYRLYVLYPKMTRLVDDILQHKEVKAWIEISGDIWVKDFVQLRSFWTRVYQQIWKEAKIQKQRLHNEKAEKLKEQIKQMDKKYPIPKIKQKQNVF